VWRKLIPREGKFFEMFNTMAENADATAALLRQRITKLKPVGGFCAETAGAVTLLGTALWGIPVSTTHTITGAIMGVGATHRLSAVRWGVANRIIWAWILTIPAAAAVSMLAYYALPFGGN